MFEKKVFIEFFYAIWMWCLTQR